jgi:hypothetical protein
VRTPGELKQAVRNREAGEAVELLVFGFGRYRQTLIETRGAPAPAKPPSGAPVRRSK